MSTYSFGCSEIENIFKQIIWNIINIKKTRIVCFDIKYNVFA